MGTQNFEPKISDQIERDGERLNIAGLATIKPDGNDVVHVLRFE